jgi:outer membrane protein OmpA-like peptidoglycan-associated protein
MVVVMRNCALIAMVLILAGCATPALPPYDPAWSSDSQRFREQAVSFESRDSTLNADARRKVGEVAAYLSANPAAAVRIEGHARDLGTEEDNRELGDARAQAVREELVRSGIAVERIDTISYGQDELPVAKRYSPCAEFVLLTPPL